MFMAMAFDDITVGWFLLNNKEIELTVNLIQYSRIYFTRAGLTTKLL